MILLNVEGEGETEVKGLVDPGSNVNFILERVAEKMETGPTTMVQIKVVNQEFTENKTKVYQSLESRTASEGFTDWKPWASRA